MKNLHSTLDQGLYRSYFEDLLLEAHLWLSGIREHDRNFEDTFISTLLQLEKSSLVEKKNTLDFFDHLIACNNRFLPKLYRSIYLLIENIEELLELPSISKPVFNNNIQHLNKQLYLINRLLTNWAEETCDVITKLRVNREFQPLFDLFSMN